MREIFAAHERWRRAASEFNGLGKRLQAWVELRNIRLYYRGYQVAVIRRGVSINRCFPGFSEASLRAAMHFRDELLPAGVQERANPIPTKVLKALGLSIPVRGIARVPSRSAYVVSYQNAKGKSAGRTFYYRQVSEVEAYAAAVMFRREVLEGQARR